MDISCRNESCENFNIVPHSWPNDLYRKAGLSSQDFQIYHCNSCNRQFIFKNYNLFGGLTEPELNIYILRLVNAGKSINEICKMAGIAPNSFYARVRHICNSLTEYENCKMTGFIEDKDIVNEIIKDKNLIVSYEKNSLYLVNLAIVNNDASNFCDLSHPIKDELETLDKLSLFRSWRHKCEPPAAELLLQIFRICHNFCGSKRQNQTPPAVRLGYIDQAASFPELLAIEI